MSNKQTTLFEGDLYVGTSVEPSVYGIGSVNIEGNLVVNGSTTITGTISASHSTLTGLAADDHTQYALLIGRSGGQILTGGSASGNILTLRSTSNATKGSVFLDETTASTTNNTGALTSAGGIGITNTTDAVSSTNGGTLTTAGGVAIAKRLYVGTDLSVGGTITSGTWNGTTITVLNGGTGQAFLNPNAVLLGNNVSGIQSPTTITYSSSTLTLPRIISNDTTTTTSNTTGSLTVAGGIGISNTTDAISATNGGTITTAGGVAIAKKLYVGTDLAVGGILTVTGSTNISHSALSNLSNDDHSQYPLLTGRSGGQVLTGGTASGNVLTLRSTSNATKGSVLLDETTATTSNSTGSFRTAGGIGISNTTDAISATNGGTITTAGGVAIAKKLFVGTDLSVSGNVTSGVWNGTTIAVANGGTGVTTSTGTGSVVLSTSPTLVTPVLGVATGTSVSVTGNMNSLTHTLTGSTSGVITIQTQAVAGTYNYNLPITAGTAGQVLTSQAGGSNAMTWTTPTTGTVTSVALAVPSFLNVSGSPVTSSGTITVGLSGTALPVVNGGTGTTTSTGTGNVVLSSSPTLVTPVLGVATGTSLSVTGNMNSLTQTITGSTSGVITIQAQAVAGTYNYNLPITAGTAGQVLTSQAGGGTAMTWTTPITSIALSVPSFLNVSGSPLTANGTITLGLSGTALPVANGGTGTTTSTGTGSVVLSTSPTLVTPVLGVATGTSVSLTGNMNSLTHTFTGATSGVITIQAQAVAGTYNYNLPITAGTAGQVLTSQAGGSNAMTWTTPTTGTVTSIALAVPSFLNVSGSPITSSGTITVGLSGTALPVANGGTGTTTSTGTGNVVLSSSPTLVTPVLGAATGTSLSVTGNVNSLTQSITGSTSGVISIQAQPVAGTYNYNLPISAGTAGQVLTSQAGGSNAMTWTTPTTGTVTSVALAVPSFLNVSGSPITSSGTITVGLSGTALPVVNGGTGTTTSTGTGNVVLSSSPTLVTPVLGAATGTSLSVTGNVNSLTQTFTGATSGVITIQTQSVAGTYNYNLPITAGTAGQVLTSQAGGSNAMTWTTPITSIALAVPSFLSVSGSPLSANGTITVGLSGTALPVANGGTGTTTSTGTGSVVLSTTPTLVTPVLGVASGTSINLTGTTASTSNTTGVITSSGGIGISNSTDATSSTNGGSLSTAGGVAIAKKLFVGDTASFANTLNMNSTRITNLANPISSTDAANKNYVDLAVQGLDTKQSVALATTTSGVLVSSFQNGQTIDGITLVTGDRILVKDQTNQVENGIYTVNASGAPTRASDFNTGASVAGSFCFVERGTTNAESGWVCVSDIGSDVVGTNNVTFTQFSGAGSIIAGTGLTKSGNTLSVNASQTQITSLGTITSGVWNATTIAVANGGTGVTTSTGTGNVVLSSSPTLVSPVLGVATGTSLSVTGNMNSLTHTFTGATSGVITVQTQAVAGTYNYNLPITAGTAGQVLTSQAGGSNAMTWTTPTTGTVTSVALAVPSFLNVSGSPITSSGTITVGLSGTALPVVNGGTGTTTSTGTGNVVLSSSPTLVTPVLGVATGTSLSVTGNVNSLTQSITGSTSGVISIQAQAVAGTYNYNLPITAGTAGQVLTSQAGGSNAMTWTTPTTGTVTSVALAVPSFLNVSGSPITSSGTITVGLSGTALPVANGGTGVTTSTGTGNVVLSSSPTLVTPVLGVATGTSLSVTGNMNSLTHTFTGATSGVITVQTQAVAGTYNYNLPITAGTAGQVLTSQAGGSNAMTWTTPTTGTVTSVALAVPSFLNVSGSPITSSGTITVGLSGTALPVANGGTGTTTSTGTGNVVLSSSPTLVTPVLGVATGTSLSVTGNVNSLTQSITGSTSGVITVQTQAVAGTYNYNLPITAGTAGQVLTSQAGGSNAMTWTTPITSIALAVPSFLNVSGSPLTANGTITVGLSGTALPVANGGTGTTSSTGTGNVVLSSSPTLVTPVLGVATGTSLSVTGNMNSLTQTITGSTSGVITIQAQAVAGTYNYNLPITAGTSGQVLTSGGGGSTAMTWSNLSTGTVTSVALSVPSFLSISGSPITTSGTLTVGFSGTALPVVNGGTGTTTSTGSGNVVLSTSPTLVTPVLGVASGTSIDITGTTASTTNLTGSITSDGGIGISNTTDAISATNGGTITTAGGVAIAKKLFVGTDLSVGGSLTVTGGINLSHSSLLNLTVGDDHTQYAFLAGRSGGQIYTAGTASGNSLTLRSTTNATKGSVILDETTATTSSISGALRLAGGLGISNTTDAVSSTNGGSITTAGGVGIARSLHVGTTITTGSITITNSTQNALNINCQNSTTNIGRIIFTNTAGTGDFSISGDGGDIVWQGGGGRACQMAAFHEIRLTGGRVQTAIPAFIGGSNATFNTIVQNTSDSIGLRVQANGTQTVALQQWTSSVGTVYSSVDNVGLFSVAGLSVNSFYQLINVASPSNPGGATHRLYMDTADSLFKSKNSTGTVTTYQPCNTKGDIATHNGTTNVRLPVGSDGAVIVANASLANGIGWVLRNHCYIREEQVAGTNGGTATAGSWFIRTLNQATYYPAAQTDVSLSGNEITLDPGTYHIRANVPGNRCSGHTSRIFDVTNAVVLITGSSAFTTSSTAYVTNSHIEGIITVANTLNIRVEQRVITSRNTDGRGVAVGQQTETYTQVYISLIT